MAMKLKATLMEQSMTHFGKKKDREITYIKMKKSKILALTPLHSYLITIFASLKSIIYFQKLSILISTNNNIKIRLTYTHKMPKLQTFVSLIRSSDYPYLYLPISKRRWDIFIDKVLQIANTLLINILINTL